MAGLFSRVDREYGISAGDGTALKFVRESWRSDADLWYLGSSHLRAMVSSLEQGSVTSVSGGGVEHAKQIVLEKKRQRELQNVRRIVCIIGGNDYGKPDRKTGGAKVVMTMKDLEEMMAEFTRWVLGELGGVEVCTLDLIPRAAEKAAFIGGAKNWSKAVKCEKEGLHRHVQCINCFSVEPRLYRHRKGKDAGKKKWRAEQGLVVDDPAVTRYELREELYSHDGVHLNEEGQAVLRRILNWVGANDGTDFVDIDILNALGNGPFHLRAKFKF